MRLIDADELIKEVNGNPFTTDSVKSYVRISVQKMPTAQPKQGNYMEGFIDGAKWTIKEVGRAFGIAIDAEFSKHMNPPED